MRYRPLLKVCVSYTMSRNNYCSATLTVPSSSQMKGSIPRGDEIREIWLPTKKFFFAGSRRHIGADEWTWVPFWRPISLLITMKMFKWSATKTSMTTVRIRWKYVGHHSSIERLTTVVSLPITSWISWTLYSSWQHVAMAGENCP